MLKAGLLAAVAAVAATTMATETPQVARARLLQSTATETVVAEAVPVTGTVSPASPAVFRIDASPFTKMRISILPAFGNPNLAANVGASSAQPLNVDPSTVPQYVSTSAIGPDSFVIDANDAAVRTGCPRTGTPGATCTIRIAVTTTSPAAGFTLLAVADGKRVSLPAGTVVSGITQGGGASQYFTFTPATDGAATTATGVNGEVSFTLTGLAGSPALYVSSTSSGSRTPNAEDPTSYCAAYTSPDFTAAANTPAASGGLSAGSSNLALTGAGGQPLVGRISFGPGHPCYCGPSSTGCAYTVGVASSSSADFGFFSLLALDGTSAASSASVAPLLYEGVAQEYAVKTGSSQAFDFTFVPAAVSVDEPILATIHVTAFATSGTPLAAYASLLPATGTGANIIPAAGSSHYSSAALDGSATVVIRRTDAALASVCGGPSSTAPCKVRINMVSTSSGAPASIVVNGTTIAKPTLYSSFSLLAHTAAGAQLTEGAPLVSSVGQGGGQIQLFRYSLVQPTGSLVISATGLSGPVDLLVGISSVPTSMPPTRATAVYRAYSYVPSSNSNAGSATTGGSAVIVLTANDPDVLACTFPCAVVVGVMQGALNQPEGSSVAGPATPTHFSLSVRTRSGAPSALLEGLPSADGGLVGDSNYYVASLPLTVSGEATSLTLNLRALGVASAVNKAVAAPLGTAVPASVRLFARVTDGTPVSPSTAQFSSPVLTVGPRAGGKANVALPETETSVTISSVDPSVLGACPATGASAKAVCSISVMVQVTNADGSVTTVSGADIASAAYSLTAYGSRSSRPLQEGVPVTAGVVASPLNKVLAGGPSVEVLFHYTLPTGATHAHITLTPLSGSPLASISVTGVMIPSVERVTADYTLGGLNSQSSISFAAKDIPACKQAAQFGASQCTVFISVSHATLPPAIEPITELPITAGGLAVFRLTATSTVLNPLPIGLPSTGRVLGPGDDSTEWFSVTVPAVDPATGNAPSGLVLNLQSTTGGYGVLAVTRDVDASTGAPRLPRPTCGGQGCTTDNVDGLASFWSSQGTYMYRTKLTINDNGDGLFAFPATYYVAVASALASDFTLSASLISSTGSVNADTGAPILAVGHNTLLPGLPFEDYLAATGDEAYFKVLVPAPTAANGNDGAYIAIQGAATYGDIAISVSLNPSNTRPKPTDTTTFAASGGLTGYRVAVPPPSLAGCARDDSNANMCQLWVTVKATAGPALYTVALQSDPSAQILFPLQEGRVARSAVLQNTHTYFVAQVPMTSVPLHFSLSEIQGKCELYVKGVPATLQGTNMVPPTSLPNRLIKDGTSSKILGVQTLTLQPGSGPAHPGPGGRVILAVFGSLDCAFALTYTTPSTVSRLEDGLSQDGSIGVPGSFAYYMFRPKAQPGDIKVSIASATGRAMLYASRWPSAAYNQAFRVTNAGNGGFEMTSAGGGVLTIPGDGSSTTACPLDRDDCAYQIAVWCDDAQAAGGPAASPCNFVITASTSTGRPLTLVDSTLYRGRVGGFVHRYFTFAAPPPPLETADPAVFTVDMSVETGLAQVLIAPAYLADGITPAPLPTADDPSTYLAASTTDNPSLTFNIPTTTVRGLTQTSPNYALMLQRSRMYYVAVYSLQAPTQFTVSVTYASRPLPLLTNVMSQGKVLAAGASMSFNLQLLDPTRDMVVLASLLYGSVTVAVGSRDRVPQCSWSTVPGGIASRRPPVCFGAQWQDSSATDNLAAVRVPAANACSSPNLVAGVACDHGVDWQVGSYFITVTAHEDTAFTLTGATSNGFLRALNGVPAIVYQAANGAVGTADFIPPTPILYQVLPEPSNPEIRLTIAPMSSPLSSNFDFYISSCVDALCTSRHEYPSAGNAQLRGRVRAGSRLDVSITKSSPAYCVPTADLASDGLNHVCNYFVTLVPTGCTPQQAASGNCNAVATLTATALSASAAVTLDYPSIGDKLTTLRAEAAPARTSRYFMFVKSSSQVASDVFLRLELCDSMAGYVSAYLCEEPYSGLTLGDGTAISAINGQPFCSQPKNPNADNNAQLTLSTSADTDGGEGRARISIIGTRTRQLFAAVTVPDPVATYQQAYSRFGASSYEYQVVVGRGWHLKQPTKDGVGAIKIKYNTADRTTATISWLPPLLYNDSSVTGWNSAYAATTGLTYRIYVAYKSFATAAALATNTTAGLAGIIPTTACGLERWVSITGKNASVFETTASSITIGGLRVNKPYQVNVVAVCDEVCLRANGARRGWPDVTTGLSAQRVPYAVTAVQTPPEPSPLPTEEGYDLSPSTVVSVLAPIGIVVCALMLLAVVYMFYKQHKRATHLANAKLSGKTAAGGAGASSMVAVSSGATAGAAPVVTVAREHADGLFKPRDYSTRRALFGPQSPRTASQTAGGYNQQQFAPTSTTVGGVTSVMNPAAGYGAPQAAVVSSAPVVNGAPAADYLGGGNANTSKRQARGGAPMQEFASPQQPPHHQHFTTNDAVEITLGTPQQPQRAAVQQQQSPAVPQQQQQQGYYQQQQQQPSMMASPAVVAAPAILPQNSWDVPEFQGGANVVVNGGGAASSSSNPWD